uniref:Putative lipocalin-3 1 n=1 Tax=Amblyomma cajennense TaxID=34607 RepID=A0A023FTW4_AMBCJ
MADARISSVLLFAFLLTAVSADNGVVQNSTVDVVKFVEENRKVWVYRTTEPGNVTCRLDTYTNVTATEALIFRSFLNGTRIEKNLKAKFAVLKDELPHEEGPPFNAMEINDLEIQREYTLIEEVFEFQSDAGKCAVVMVLDNTSGFTATWLDLRVSDTSVGTGPTKECTDEFEKILSYYVTKPESRTSYSNECKRNSS